jgi:hypothetical protein
MNQLMLLEAWENLSKARHALVLSAKYQRAMRPEDIRCTDQYLTLACILSDTTYPEFQS